MLSVVMLSVVMLSVIMLSVVMLSVIAPFAPAIHFHPSLIFEGKAKSSPLEWSPIMSSPLSTNIRLRCK
jgi:hypothetical protein